MRRRLEVVVPLAVFLLVFAVHARSSVVEPTDSLWTLHTATSLLDHGDLDLDEYGPLLQRDHDYAIVHAKGHAYEYFPSGTAVLTVPILAAGRLLGQEPSLADGPDQGAQRTIASLYVAATAALLVLIGRRASGRVGVGVGIAIVFAFATSAWSTADRALWQHAPSMMLLALALLIAQRAKHRPFDFVALGILLALAYFVRPTNAVSALAFLAWVLIAHRRQVGWMIGGAALIAIGFVALNLHSFGTILPPYFAADRLSLGADVFNAAAGNLVSPARGLLVYSPVVAFAALGFVMRRRRGELTTLERCLGGAVVVHFVAISTFPHWWGGWQYGPRFWSDVLPYLCLFLVPVVARLLTEQGRAELGAVVVALFTIAFLWSVWVNAKGATNQRTFDWNHDPSNVDDHPSRIWDWTDPPFLRS